MCKHNYHRIPLDHCNCTAADHTHMHGSCQLCGFTRTFKVYDVPEHGLAWSSEQEVDALAVKRKRGQQKMRESIALGARPGQRWSK